MIHPQRINELSQNPGKQNVIYWMSRDQRVKDNWGLLYARQLAEENQTELAVVFCLVDNFLEAGLRQYDFMLHGLGEVAHDLQVKNIPFYLLTGNPPQSLMDFSVNHNVSHIICDFDPLRIKQKWQKEILKSQKFNLIEVDSHNIVPARIVSNKVEFGAYTIRPKIRKKLNEFLGDYPSLKPQNKTKDFSIQSIVWSDINKKIKADKAIGIVEWLHPGESSASDILDFFINSKLDSYNTDRNDPNKDALSNLSPYLHFGQISAQRIALEILKRVESDENSETYLEELIIRRELSDNYCLYNPQYDSLENIPDWAKKTLSEHEADEREFIYNLEAFEKSHTHEKLWNAAQNELVISGKLHGYMRRKSWNGLKLRQKR